MTDENIKKRLAELEQLTSGVKDPILRLEAFKQLVEQEMAKTAPTRHSAGTIHSPSHTTVASPHQEQTMPANTEQALKTLADELGSKVDTLHARFSFEEGGPRFLKLPTEKTRTKLQLKSLQLLAILLKRVYDRPTFNATETMRLTKGLPTERIDNLNKVADYVRVFSGNAKSLKLTWQGEKESIELLRNYVSAKNE